MLGCDTIEEPEVGMRWDALFADLEAQAEALDAAERVAEIEERARIEYGRLGFAARIAAGVGAPVRIRCGSELAIDGVLLRSGPDWLLIDEGSGHEAIVVSAAIAVIHGLSRYSAALHTGSAVSSRLDLRHVLRGLARDRAAVRLAVRGGDVVTGTVDRVGADFLELAVHSPAELRRRGDVHGTAVVPIARLAAVRRSA